MHDGVEDMTSLVMSEGRDFKRSAIYHGSDYFSLHEGVFAAWYRIVKQYSRRALTYESDRLPAISGIARSIGSSTGFTYLAGIWAQDPHGLAWCLDRPDERVTHQCQEVEDGTENAYPSWSWAKMKHSISWRFYEQPRTNSKQDAVILLPEPSVNHMVDLHESTHIMEIRIEAACLDVQCIPAHFDARHLIRDFHDTSSSYEKLDEGQVRAYREGFALDVFHKGVQIGTACFDEPSTAEGITDCRAVCIAGRVYSNCSIEIMYFLLVRQQARASPAWERIGLGMTRDTAWNRRGAQEYYENVFEGLAREHVILR